eukprot:TRINITY_DN10135_c0_g1_i4.p1 TRINITY_DN10135_c0_g1~~TRINITY_DN10135_c0_g1_i4.p1  ORF type:complete len:224 (+),score=55.83 TRINITY_DN10135_c0_g1_i4:58-729(+)
MRDRTRSLTPKPRHLNTSHFLNTTRTHSSQLDVHNSSTSRKHFNNRNSSPHTKFNKFANTLTNLIKDINEKVKEKELLIKLNMKLREEIIYLKNNAQTLHKQQNKIYISTEENLCNVSRLNETLKECVKKIIEYKKPVIALGEHIDKLNNDNNKLQRKIAKERKVNSKYKELVKMLKETIISTRKKVVSMRSLVIASANKRDNLKEKYDKEFSSLDKMYSVIE